MKVTYFSMIWKKRKCGCVARWTGCSKMLTVGEHRWGVFGVENEEKKALVAFYCFFFPNKNPQDGSRGTLLKCVSLQPSIRWPYYLIWKARCEIQQRIVFALWTHLYEKLYVSMNTKCYLAVSFYELFLFKYHFVKFGPNCIWNAVCMGISFWWEYPQLSPCLTVVRYHPQREKVEGFKKVALCQCLNDIRVGGSLNHFFCNKFSESVWV